MKIIALCSAGLVSSLLFSSIASAGVNDGKWVRDPAVLAADIDLGEDNSPFVLVDTVDDLSTACKIADDRQQTEADRALRLVREQTSGGTSVLRHIREFTVSGCSASASLDLYMTVTGFKNGVLFYKFEKGVPASPSIQLQVKRQVRMRTIRGKTVYQVWILNTQTLFDFLHHVAGQYLSKVSK